MKNKELAKKEGFKPKKRIGIIIISIIYFIATVAYIALAIVSFIIPEIFTNIPGFKIPVSNQMPFISFGIILIALAIFSFFIAIGLLKHQKWSVFSAIIISTIFIIGGVLSLIEKSYLSIINLIFNLLIVIYLIFYLKKFDKKKINM